MGELKRKAEEVSTTHTTSCPLEAREMYKNLEDVLTEAYKSELDSKFSQGRIKTVPLLFPYPPQNIPRKPQLHLLRNATPIFPSCNRRKWKEDGGGGLDGRRK